MTDAELSRAVQSRDEAAMEVIINRYSRLLWRVCAAVLRQYRTNPDKRQQSLYFCDIIGTWINR